jgi:hypothetical protein
MDNLAKKFNIHAFILTVWYGMFNGLYKQSIVAIILYLASLFLMWAISGGMGFEPAVAPIKQVLTLFITILPFLISIYWGLKANSWIQAPPKNILAWNIFSVIYAIAAICFTPIYLYLMFFLFVTSGSCTTANPGGCP